MSTIFRHEGGAYACPCGSTTFYLMDLGQQIRVECSVSDCPQEWELYYDHYDGMIID